MNLQEKLLATYNIALHHLIQAENYKACATMHNEINNLKEDINLSQKPVIIDLTKLVQS